MIIANLTQSQGIPLPLSILSNTITVPYQKNIDNMEMEVEGQHTEKDNDDDDVMMNDLHDFQSQPYSDHDLLILMKHQTETFAWPVSLGDPDPTPEEKRRKEKRSNQMVHAC